MQKRAAIYVRSSKDRTDVSIHAQKRELQKLATEKGLTIVREFADVVESAKDERRPGFQELLAELKHVDRSWGYLLMVDTSRLSRRQYMAQVFSYEAKKRGIKILYSKIPESDPIADLVVISTMQTFDELHSLMSKEKGLAGMAENVRQGWRAGGRAPTGYRLKSIETGAIREGAPVTKTVLEPSSDADTVKAYLSGRVEGRSRRILIDELCLPWSCSTLVGMEWNALTYAGHTVWNVHRDKNPDGGYRGGTKRRPRAEWVIRKNTHEALISDDQAEILLSRMEHNGPKLRRRKSTYMLSGMLMTPRGQTWHGDGHQTYRIRMDNGRYRTISAQVIEHVIVGRVFEDLKSTVFVDELVAEAKRTCKAPPPKLKPLKAELQDVERRVQRTMQNAEDLEDPSPALRRVEVLEKERKQLEERLKSLEEKNASRDIISGLSRQNVKRLLSDVANSLEDVPPADMREALGDVLDRVVLDPDTRQCDIHYRIGTRDKLASPTGFEPVSPP